MRMNWRSYVMMGGLSFALVCCIASLCAQNAPEPLATPTPVADDTESADPPAMGEDQAETVNDVDKQAQDQRHRPDHYPTIVRVGSNAEVNEDETVSEMVVVMGEAIMKGAVYGDVVVVAGKAFIDGEIRGQLVAPFTTVELGPNAHIHGDLVAVMGSLNADPAAKIDGERVAISWDELEKQVPFIGVFKSIALGLKDWAVKGPLLGRFLPHQWGWWWWVAIGCGMLYLLCGLILQRPVAAGVAVLQEKPVVSFFAGLLGYLGFCVITTILTISGLGVLIIPFLLCAAIAAQFLGKVVVCQGFGAQVLHQSGGPVAGRPLLALLIGLVLLTVVAVIPFIGMLVAFVLAPLGFGAVLIATLQAFKRERGPADHGLPPTGLPPSPLSTPAVSLVPIQGVPPVMDGTPSASVPGEVETLPRAGFWVRLGATCLDLILVLALLAMLHIPELFLFGWLLYHVGMWSWRGTTIGGIILGLRVIRRDGRAVAWPVAVVRSLASVLSFIAFGLGFFWAGWTREKTAWHDLIAGTLVVRTPRGTPLI